MITQITQEGAFDATLRRQINANFNNLSFVTQGNIWWVRPVNGSDSNDGKTSATAFKTCAAALAAATANQNDIVLLCGEGNALASATDFQATTLNWNKDMVHLMGVNDGCMIGQRARIDAATALPAFANLFVLSANACMIRDIEFFQGPGSTTLPMVIFSKVRLGVSPDVNALATMMVLVVACGVVGSSAWMRAVDRRQARERAQAGE